MRGRRGRAQRRLQVQQKGALKHSKKAPGGTAGIRKGASKHSKKAPSSTAGRSKSAWRYSKRRPEAPFCLQSGSLTAADKSRMLPKQGVHGERARPVRNRAVGRRRDGRGCGPRARILIKAPRSRDPTLDVGPSADDLLVPMVTAYANPNLEQVLGRAADGPGSAYFGFSAAVPCHTRI